jgi:hypothetical protein
MRCCEWSLRRLLADWLDDGGALLDFLINPSVRGRTTATVFGGSRKPRHRRRGSTTTTGDDCPAPSENGKDWTNSRGRRAAHSFIPHAMWCS